MERGRSKKKGEVLVMDAQMTASRRIDWKEVVRAVKQELNNFTAEGYKPTLRAMFYRLYSNGLIPNTPNAYDRLSKVTVEARWKSVQFSQGRNVSDSDEILPIDCFADNSCDVLGDFDETYWKPEQLIDVRIKRLKDTETDYVNRIPRWHNQPLYVEIWIEKQAMGGTFESILNGYDVRIVPNRGFASMTFVYENVQRLKKHLTMGEKVHVLYYGDFDPSGDYMDTDLKNRLVRFGLGDKIDFERVAVTPKQIEKYNLPYDPDKETKLKMGRDVQTNGFLEKYGKLYAVELDALPAKIPDEFRRLVVEKVEQYFDEDIYNELVEKYKPQEIRKLLRTKLSRLVQSI